MSIYISVLCNRYSEALLITSIANKIDTISVSFQTNTTDFVHQIQAQCSEFAVVTYDGPDRPALFEQIRKTSRNTCIVLCDLSNKPDLITLVSLLDMGLIDTICSLDELQECLRTLISGQLYGSALFGSHYCQIIERIPGWNELTKCERRILIIMAEGKTSLETANLLNVSYRTINNHKYNISQKLSINGGPGSLVKFVMQHSELLLSVEITK